MIPTTVQIEVYLKNGEKYFEVIENFTPQNLIPKIDLSEVDQIKIHIGNGTEKGVYVTIPIADIHSSISIVENGRPECLKE